MLRGLDTAPTLWAASGRAPACRKQLVCGGHQAVWGLWWGSCGPWEALTPLGSAGDPWWEEGFLPSQRFAEGLLGAGRVQACPQGLWIEGRETMKPLAKGRAGLGYVRRAEGPQGCYRDAQAAPETEGSWRW